MKANYEGESGIRVIRPLVYTRESATRAFAGVYVL
jgi:tRNA(Ile)-lysidine synthase TilS/MesJ